MATIKINVEDCENAAVALREVADKIEQGYTHGTIGWSSDTWSIAENDDKLNNFNG